MRLVMAMLLPLVCITGCPEGPCAPAQKGAIGARCAEIVCPTAAHIDEHRSCVCADGSTVIAGACVPYKLADTFCGHAATPQPGGGCAPKKCGAGQALDLDHGLCLPEAAARATLLSQGSRNDDDTRRPSCLYGALVSHGATNQLSCAMGPLSCGRGQHFVHDHVDAGAGQTLSGTCNAPPPCGAGELFDDVSSSCVRVVRASPESFIVDVGAWARLALGADGAEGQNGFCAPVRATGSEGRFQIELTFPNNDVTQAAARLTQRPGTLPNASDAAERSLEQLIETLHYYGGTASAASVSLEISCIPPMAASPTLEIPKSDLDGGR
jgi:hypothetical protein